MLSVPRANHDSQKMSDFAGSLNNEFEYIDDKILSENDLKGLKKERHYHKIYLKFLTTEDFLGL